MKIRGAALCIATVAISGSAIMGCHHFPESTFELANVSRLPKWFDLPPGLARSDVSVEMSYYIKPWGRSATFTLQDPRGQITLSGKMKCSEPFHLTKRTGAPASDYPSYGLITVNGISEVIEHRKMEPVFYISDDPAVREAIFASGCS